MDDRVLGILGGGQLGRMMVEAAHRLNIQTVILDSPGSPAKQINARQHVDGSFADADAIRKLAKQCKVLTTEIEHVDAGVLEELNNAEDVVVHPSPRTIRLIQDKYLQKTHLVSHEIATPFSLSVESNKAALLTAGHQLGYPFMLKSRTLAYDGRGNFVIKDETMIDEALKTLNNRPLYCEEWAPFTKELAVMVIRRLDGSVASYPTVETIHQNNICHMVYAPARVSLSVRERARILAERAISCLEGAGVFGVEMFLLEDGNLLVNEIAPRPHNSGHYTIEACPTSQYEAHLRAILDLPLPSECLSMSTSITNAIMINILGGREPTSHLQIARKSLQVPGSTLHLYGKGDARQGRKMGHITIVGSSMADCEYKLSQITNERVTSTPSAKSKSGKPLVGIIMGSDSDLPKMRAASDTLDEFQVPHEVRVISAHRTPEAMYKYARDAASRSIRVIIAGAGGAAHLPGMTASMTTLPVIGVPVKGRILDGIDSLHSIVQMPRGVPVACVAIDNSTNAGLLAVRILASSMPQYRLALEEYSHDMETTVLEKDTKLLSLGAAEYAKGMLS